MKTILIAEDDTFLRTLYAKRLRGKAIDVQTAKDGAQAMIHMEKAQPDLLALDLMMPSLDGFSVLEQVRKRGWTFPVIVLTNLRDDRDLKRCEALGVTRIIAKSELELGELKAWIEQLLGV